MSAERHTTRMLPPLLETLPSAESESPRYTPESVKAYKQGVLYEGDVDKNHFAERHYSQASMEWGDSNTVRTLMNRLEIDQGKITVFGGYTGEFSDALTECGYDVVFTDPNPEWVEIAHENGTNAYEGFVETLELEPFSDTTAFASFECYHPFIEPSYSVYNTLRLLTAPHGILMAESDKTMAELKNERGTGTFSSSFTPFCEEYNVERRYRETDGLRIYQIAAFEETSRERIYFDGTVLASLYRTSERDGDVHVESELISRISESIGSDGESVLSSLRRTTHLYRASCPQWYRDLIQPNTAQLYDVSIEM